MVIRFGGKSANEKNIENLLYLFLMPLIVDLVSVFVRQNGMGSSSSITMILYGISLVVILVRTRCIEISDLAMVAGIYGIVALNYLAFDDTRTLLLGTDMLIIYMFFIPICVISVRHIRDWSKFMDKMALFSFAAVAISTFIMVFLDYTKYLVYMGFSYALLPFVACLYRTGRKTGKIIYYAFFAVGTIEMLIFGARAVILFLLLYIAISEILDADKSAFYKFCMAILFIAATFILFYGMETIALFLSGFEIFEDSYFVRNLLRGQLFESESRELIYESCRDRIASMGLEITGFFGDRAYCLGQAYPHNILYELLISWGWIIGGGSILALGGILIKSLLIKKGQTRDIAILMIITGFARYVISGSYLIEGKFWVLVFVIIALLSSEKQRNPKYTFA